jgi:hypothetical protein
MAGILHRPGILREGARLVGRSGGDHDRAIGVREIPAQLNYPVLVTYAVDGTPEFNPDHLADVRQDVVDGNTRVTYTINPKVHFNDGTPLDWKTLERIWRGSPTPFTLPSRRRSASRRSGQSLGSSTVERIRRRRPAAGSRSR